MSLSYLALGDSYTIGEGVLPQFNYPNLTRAYLLLENIPIEKLKVIAKTGWTTADLMEAVQKKGLKNQKFDLVTLLIGVNNQYRGQSLNQYETEFGSLLSFALEKAKGQPKRVTVISIPDWGVTAFGKSGQKKPSLIAEEIDQFNKVNSKLASDYGTNYLDITAAYRENGSLPSHQAEDGLHPSPLIYEQWAASLSRMIIENFTRE